MRCTLRKGASAFQSQLGSIGALPGGPLAPQGADFQSQLGSIGASCWASCLATWPAFQSQLGSIGALLVDPQAEAPYRAFNPSLVRLARCDPTPCHKTLLPFNPSLVRLAPQLDLEGEDRIFSFQSQLGSIGARPGLKGHLDGDFFQSQLGSIGARRRRPNRRRICPFNPSLVRLAPGGPQPPFWPGPLSIPAWFDWRAGSTTRVSIL